MAVKVKPVRQATPKVKVKPQRVVPPTVGTPKVKVKKSEFDQSLLTDEEFEALLEWCLQNLPEKFTGYRPHQKVAIRQALEAYTRVDLVILDAPTGTGKTLIAETLRLIMGEKATYICNNKGLQDQFAKDFDYAKVLKGRKNYVPLYAGNHFDVTCADCDKEGGPSLAEMSCTYCQDDCVSCPYEVAKTAAVRSKLAVINTAYMMAEANFVGNMSGRGFGILDECDTLEDELMGFTEFRVTEHRMRDLGIRPPKKGVHKPTLAAWLRDELIPAIDQSLVKLKATGLSKLEKDRKIRGLAQLRDDAVFVAGELDELWVRDYERTNRRGRWEDSDALILKPVKVSRYGVRYLWRHADKWLAMSATVVSAEEFTDSLGTDETWVNDDGDEYGPYPYEVIRVPMTFPVENRPVYFCPIAKMSRSGEEEGLPKLLDAIVDLCKNRPVRTLIHAHKYALANEIVAALERRVPGRKIVTYRGANEKDLALARFMQDTSAILVAVSMDRGVDLPDDLCRLQILTKVPFPYLGDKQVSEREKSPGGKEWYATQTARVILQACGRGVRHSEDWCETWILDQNFGKFYQKNKVLFPEWWREGFQRVQVREFAQRIS